MNSKTRGRGLSRLGASVAALLAIAVIGPATAGATTTVAASAAQLQSQINEQLQQYPGGTQTAVNKVSYDGGNAVVVFPLVGQSKVPSSDNLASGVSPQDIPGDVHGCPDGFSDHWYCFYADAGYSGRMLQFLDCSSSGYKNLFSSYGFQNQTTSWVNTRNGGTIQVFQGSSTLLWSEGANQSSSNVGAAHNDQADRAVCFS
jgi:Peptidase inhibitor family I36